jgi:hypothetical protein
MHVSPSPYQRSAVLNQSQTGRGTAERKISMESAIKIGQQFEFALRVDKEFRQKAVVIRVLSNREEGIGPEADYYISDWIEARTLAEPPEDLVFVLANDWNVYLNGELVDIIVDLAA